MTAEQKLTKISNMLDHPGAFHWTGTQMAKAIRKVINDDSPIEFLLSEQDQPIDYELVHDAVFEDGAS